MVKPGILLYDLDNLKYQKNSEVQNLSVHSMFTSGNICKKNKTRKLSINRVYLITKIILMHFAFSLLQKDFWTWKFFPAASILFLFHLGKHNSARQFVKKHWMEWKTSFALLQKLILFIQYDIFVAESCRPLKLIQIQLGFVFTVYIFKQDHVMLMQC